MAFYDKFPYTNFQEINLDRIIQQLVEVQEGLQFVIDNASLKYADPIQWDITRQYQANTVVIDPATNIAYLSTKPVPANILITNTDYWTPIFDLSPFMADIENINTEIDTINTEIDTINTDITDIRNDIDSVQNGIYGRVIFPVLSLNYDPTGNCMIIAVKDHAVLIDLSRSANQNSIKTTLQSEGITTIDAIFITHYHADHSGENYADLNNSYRWLTDNFDCSNTVCYIPKTPLPSIFDASDAIAALTHAFNCITTDNNTRYEFFDMVFTVSNASDSDFTYYNSNTTDYNEFSNIIRINYKGVQLLNTGDIGPLAQQRCYEQGYAEPCELVTIPHHGVNGTASNDFMNHIRPSYAYISNALLGYESLRDPNVFRAAHYGTVFDNRSNRTYPVKFGITEAGIVANGVVTKVNGYAIEKTNIIHVNPTISAELYMDGTSLYPYKTMPMAINSAYGMTTIELAADYNGTVIITGDSGLITINGNGHQIGTYIGVIRGNVAVNNGSVSGAIRYDDGAFGVLHNISHSGSITVVDSKVSAIECTVTADVPNVTCNRAIIELYDPTCQANPTHRIIDGERSIVTGAISLGKVAVRSSVGLIRNTSGFSDFGRLADPGNNLLYFWKDSPPIIVYDTQQGKYARIVNGTLQYVANQ